MTTVKAALEWWRAGQKNGPSASLPTGIPQSPLRLPLLTFTTFNKQRERGKRAEHTFERRYNPARTHNIAFHSKKIQNDGLLWYISILLIMLLISSKVVEHTGRCRCTLLYFFLKEEVWFNKFQSVVG